MADTQSPHTGEQVTEAALAKLNELGERLADHARHVGGDQSYERLHGDEASDGADLIDCLVSALRLTTAARQPEAMADQSTETRLREALVAELRLWRSLVVEGGVPRYTIVPGAALNTVVTSTDHLLARTTLNGEQANAG